MKALILVAIAAVAIAAAIALWAVTTASYSDAQEPTPAVEATATPSIYDQLPTQMTHHSSDVNFTGSVNIVDVFIVAHDAGEVGAGEACAIVITAGSYFDLVSCP